MAAPQNFRTAFSGFNREDVVHYLEYLNTKHQNQLSQLNAELETLRGELAAQPTLDLSELDTLREERDALRAQLEESETARLALETRCAELEQSAAVPAPAETKAEELDTYRRAQNIERESLMRAELVYFQANGVLTEANAKVDSITKEITELADQAMQDLTRLQVAVSGSKHTLQDAADMMKAIRPKL